jgi:4-diphosphocytidyl-2-C-methyl-D-erythritol kinase
VNSTARPTIAFAPAKLNLFLEIVGRRDDGYHGIETLMLAVDLFDTIEFEPRRDGGVDLVCSDPAIPADGRNLVVRAAMKWDRACRIRLVKRIPSQAGMGGGSSDAAASLRAMGRMFGGPEAAVREWANELGSDVGFFLGGPAAWCTGRGEIVEPIAAPIAFHFVVVQPPVGCPTAEVYRRLDGAGGRRSGEMAREAVAEGCPRRLAQAMFNRLEAPAKRVAPEIESVAMGLAKGNPLAVQVTGSGSAVFALCRDRSDAIRVFENYIATANRGEDRIWVLRSIPTT